MAAGRGKILAFRVVTPNKAQPKVSGKSLQGTPASVSTRPKKVTKKLINPTTPVDSDWRTYSPTSPNTSSASPDSAKKG